MGWGEHHTHSPTPTPSTGKTHYRSMRWLSLTHTRLAVHQRRQFFTLKKKRIFGFEFCFFTCAADEYHRVAENNEILQCVGYRRILHPFYTMAEREGGITHRHTLVMVRCHYAEPYIPDLMGNPYWPFTPPPLHDARLLPPFDGEGFSRTSVTSYITLHHPQYTA